MKHNKECIHIPQNLRPEIYQNFGNFKEISEKFRGNFREVSSNTIMNVYIPILTLGLKHENFGNFKEISEEVRGNFRDISLNTIINVYISILTQRLKYLKILELSNKF